MADEVIEYKFTCSSFYYGRETSQVLNTSITKGLKW